MTDNYLQWVKEQSLEKAEGGWSGGRPPAIEAMNERARNGARLWTGISLALVARDLYNWNQRRQAIQYGYAEEAVEVTGTRVVRETEQRELPAAGGKFFSHPGVQFLMALFVFCVILMIAG